MLFCYGVWIVAILVGYTVGLQCSRACKQQGSKVLQPVSCREVKQCWQLLIPLICDNRSPLEPKFFSSSNKASRWETDTAIMQTKAAVKSLKVYLWFWNRTNCTNYLVHLQAKSHNLQWGIWHCNSLNVCRTTDLQGLLRPSLQKDSIPTQQLSAHCVSYGVWEKDWAVEKWHMRQRRTKQKTWETFGEHHLFTLVLCLHSSICHNAGKWEWYM